LTLDGGIRMQSRRSPSDPTNTITTTKCGMIKKLNDDLNAAGHCGWDNRPIEAKDDLFIFQTLLSEASISGKPSWALDA
jgi:hypothetical protein